MAVKSKVTPEKLDYFQYAESIPEGEEVPWYKSYPAAAAKGLTEGMISLGQAFGPLGTNEERSKQNEMRQLLMNDLLPSNQGPAEGLIEKTGKLAPFVASGGTGALGTLLRSVLGAAGGETANQLGIGELGQGLAELPGLIGPDLVRRIPTVGRQSELANFARDQGLTEEQLALTLRNKGGGGGFAEDVASKGGKTVRAFDSTREALGRVWGNLTSSPEAQQVMTGKQSSDLINNISRRLSRLPAESRNRIQGDYNDLLSSQMTGADVINFWQDLNYYIQRGERNLGTLKQDLQKSLDELSPQLGQDFKITNELYGNFANLAERMGPDIAEHLIRAGEQGIALSAITTGNFPLLKKLLGPVGARVVAREMVINPRLQNLSNRFISGVKQGLPAVAKESFDQLVLELGKNSAEAAMALSDFDVEEFLNSLPKEATKQQKEKQTN